MDIAWEVATFFALLGVSRATQWLKQRRFFPGWKWLTKVKMSRCGNFEYTKLRVFWLRSFNYMVSALLMSYCLYQKYPDPVMVGVLVVIIELNSALRLPGKVGMCQMKRKQSGHGLFKPW
jgi:hypothetical protein